MSSPSKENRTWTRDGFFISTDPSLIDIRSLNDAFDSEMMYWTRRMPEDALQHIVNNSLCFGMYLPSSSGTEAQADIKPNMIGFARLITDRATFCYLTDVYILPQHQNRKLGTWLISCVQETVDSWPHHRWTLAVVGGGEHDLSGFYQRLMRLRVFMGEEEGCEIVHWKGPGSVF